MAFWDRLAWHTKYKGLSHVLVDALNVNKMSLHDLLVDDGDKPRAVARAMMLLWIECVAEAECTVRDKTRAVALAAAAAAGASDVTSAAASAVEPLLPWLGGLFPACCDNAAAGSQAFECWVTRLDNAGALKPGVSTRLREVGASADSDDVVDVATGSTGTLNLPDDYVRTDSPSAGIEQLIFAPQGPLADPAARRAVALCTPRDVIARNAEVPVVNTRLNPAAEDSITAAEAHPDADAFNVANPDAARDAIGGQPLAVRIGYQRPNARLAAAVGAMAKSCAAAGITVQDVSSDSAGPQALRDNQFDVLLASTGGATGSGSSGSSAIDAYDLHSGNGNNLSGYANEMVDGVIGAMAVTTDPKELARLLGESAPVLWGDMPTLPLYRQQRTLLTSKKMVAVSSNPTRWGAGWNMDRWMLKQ